MRTLALTGAALICLAAATLPANAQASCSSYRAACFKACAGKYAGCTNICADAHAGCMKTGTWRGRTTTQSGLRKQ
jgi:hypothetical protein